METMAGLLINRRGKVHSILPSANYLGRDGLTGANKLVV